MHAQFLFKQRWLDFSYFYVSVKIHLSWSLEVMGVVEDATSGPDNGQRQVVRKTPSG